MAQTQSTAVNWLIEQILSDQLIKAISQKEWLEVFRQAKQMEKEQLINFHIEVMKAGLINEGDIRLKDDYEPKIKATAETYYNETFNP